MTCPSGVSAMSARYATDALTTSVLSLTRNTSSSLSSAARTATASLNGADTMSMEMTNAELLCRQRPFMDAFCGCEDCADALKEQSSPALEVMDRGSAVGRTPAGLPKDVSSIHTPYTNESHKIYDGDISKLMGALS